MGQYYKPVILNAGGDITAWFYSHHYDNGLKLMEHSYVGNKFLAAVFHRLLHATDAHLVWAGDYADPPEGADLNYYQQCTFAEDKEILHQFGEFQGVKWTRVESPGRGFTETKEYKAWAAQLPKYDRRVFRYAVNHTKKQYVALNSQPPTEYDLRICPLPLLCAAGNGRGGGDYRGANEDQCGVWAGDSIAIVTLKRDVPKDYTEIKPVFNKAA